MNELKRVRLTERAVCAPQGVETEAGQEYDVLPEPNPNLFPVKGSVWVSVNGTRVWLKPGSFEVINFTT